MTGAMKKKMMRRRVALAIGCLVALGGDGAAGQGAQSCEADGDIRFVCGLGNPEDLVRIPDTPWVVASGMEDDGHL